MYDIREFIEWGGETLPGSTIVLVWMVGRGYYYTSFLEAVTSGATVKAYWGR